MLKPKCVDLSDKEIDAIITEIKFWKMVVKGALLQRKKQKERKKLNRRAKMFQPLKVSMAA